MLVGSLLRLEILFCFVWIILKSLDLAFSSSFWGSLNPDEMKLILFCCLSRKCKSYCFAGAADLALESSELWERWIEYWFKSIKLGFDFSRWLFRWKPSWQNYKLQLLEFYTVLNVPSILESIFRTGWRKELRWCYMEHMIFQPHGRGQVADEGCLHRKDFTSGWGVRWYYHRTESTCCVMPLEHVQW